MRFNSLEKTLASGLTELEPEIKMSLERELVSLREKEKDIRTFVHPLGFVAYTLGPVSFLMTTLHNGSYAPEEVPFLEDKKQRHTREEDLFTGELYLPVFLENGGFWVNTHVSRYFADLNRPKENAILKCGGLKEKRNFKRYENDHELIKKAEEYYLAFYTHMSGILDRTLVHFDGHSMLPEKQGRSRGQFCIMCPEDQDISLKYLLEDQGFNDVRLNDPFPYGNSYFRSIAEMIVQKTFQLETNRRLFLTPDLLSKSEDFEKNSEKICQAINNYIKQIKEN